MTKTMKGGERMKATNPYREGTEYRKAASVLARSIFATRRAGIQRIARACRTTVKLAGYIYDVVGNPKQGSNSGSQRVEVKGGYRLRYLTPEQTAALKA